ncbi:MAG: hypothetical protein ACKVT2_07335 [Saprospiraceae bacterium]
MANLNVEILIDQLTCENISYEPGPGNNRDEVYVTVAGNTPSGQNIKSRLPRYKSDDDYYQFFKGTTAKGQSWINQDDAPVGPPRIWAGTLKPNESAKFLVALGEQDNKSIGTIINALISFLALEVVKIGAKLVPGGEIVREWAEKAAKYLPGNTKDDIIGAFCVEVKNQDGKLFTTWLATELEFEEGGEFASTKINDSDELFVQGTNSVNLDFDGTRGARYRGIVKVNTYASLPPSVKQVRRYLGRYIDQCGNSIMTFKDDAKVLKGQLKEFRGNFGSKLKWKCGSSNEETGAIPSTTDLIVVKRAVTGREIKWYFFNEEAY